MREKTIIVGGMKIEDKDIKLEQETNSRMDPTKTSGPDKRVDPIVIEEGSGHQIDSEEPEKGKTADENAERTRFSYTVPALIAILFFAISMHLLPPTTMGFHIWGSDTGEYYAITKSITENGRVPVDYEGWGFAYPYFYGMEVVIAALHLTTGLDILTITVFVLPALSAFLVIPVFFIARKIFRDDRVALLSSLFISVSPSGVFATSHPMPGGLGDFLALLVLYFYLCLGQGKRYRGMWIMFILSVSALMVTHHMSAYFVFIAIGLYMVMRELLKRSPPAELKRDIPVLYFFLIFMIIYWLILVEPFRERIVDDTFGISGWIVMMAAILGLSIVIYLLKLRRKWDWVYVPEYPDVRNIIILLGAMAAVSSVIMVTIALMGVPGTSLEIDNMFLILVIPLLIMIILSAPGPGFARFYTGGLFIYSWLGSIVISLIIMAATENTVLLPYRHTQYLLEPVLMLSALAVVELYRYLPGYRELKVKGLVTCVIILLTLGVAYSAYPPKEVIGNFQEGTVYEEVQGVLWVREYREDFRNLYQGSDQDSLQNNSDNDYQGKIASDHRLSSLLFGISGVPATWDSAFDTLHSDDYANCSQEIQRLKITGVFIDNEIKQGVAMLQWENAEPMSDEAIEKFNEPPFIKVLDTGFVQVYLVANISK